jgi:hypothetical protein
LKLLINLWKN